MNIKAAILICIPIILTSCSDIGENKGISSGTIEYRINYPDGGPGSKDLALMPRTMKMIFDHNQAVNFIEGFLGMYGINNITQFDTRKCTTVLKVFDRYYIYKGKKDEFMCCFDDMENMIINETNDTSVIAGLKCRKAVVRLPEEDLTWEIYYTNDIALKHPNQNNPYRFIDGVLVKFELRLVNIRMEFTAENFQPNSGSKKKPDIPETGIEVNRAQMAGIINRLIE